MIRYIAAILIVASPAFGQSSVRPSLPGEPGYVAGTVAVLPPAVPKIESKLFREDGKPREKYLFKGYDDCRGANKTTEKTKLNCDFLINQIIERAKEPDASQEMKNRAAELSKQ